MEIQFCAEREFATERRRDSGAQQRADGDAAQTGRGLLAETEPSRESQQDGGRRKRRREEQRTRTGPKGLVRECQGVQFTCHSQFL